MRKRRLTSLNDLRKYLAYTANQLEAGTISTDHARCVGYLCNIMSGIIQNSDLEQRIQALEQQVGGKK